MLIHFYAIEFHLCVFLVNGQKILSRILPRECGCSYSGVEDTVYVTIEFNHNRKYENNNVT